MASRTESVEKHTTPVAAPGLAGIPVPRSFNSFEDSTEAALCINDSTNEVGTNATAFLFTSSVFIDLAFSTKSINEFLKINCFFCSFCQFLHIQRQ